MYIAAPVQPFPRVHLKSLSPTSSAYPVYLLKSTGKGYLYCATASPARMVTDEDIRDHLNPSIHRGFAVATSAI